MLIAVPVAAVSLVAILSTTIAAPVGMIRAPAAADRESPTGSGDAQDLEGEAGSAGRSPRSPGVTIESVPQDPVPMAASAVRRASDAIGSLVASLDMDVFHAGGFEVQARALAAELGPEETRELSALAADWNRPASDRVAAAELLRHSPTADGWALSEPALAALRQAWQERSGEPILASAAVRALGAFGDTGDRRRMLDSVTPDAPASVGALACAGLSAARGDESALEIARGAFESQDGRRSDVALSALTSIASDKDYGLSAGARARCADVLLGALASRAAGRQQKERAASEQTEILPPLEFVGRIDSAEEQAGPACSVRILAALAAIDPERAASALLSSLADESTSDAASQSAASALAAIPTAVPELDAMLGRAQIDQRRRVLAAEALVRSGSDPFGRARSVLERTRDAGRGTLLERRAARVLEHCGVGAAEAQ